MVYHCLEDAPFFLFFLKYFFVPCRKFGSPYLGKTQQPQQQRYPFLSLVHIKRWVPITNGQNENYTISDNQNLFFYTFFVCVCLCVCVCFFLFSCRPLTWKVSPKSSSTSPSYSSRSCSPRAKSCQNIQHITFTFLTASGCESQDLVQEVSMAWSTQTEERKCFRSSTHTHTHTHTHTQKHYSFAVYTHM